MMNQIIDYIQNKIKDTSTVGLVLGSGLEEIASCLENKIIIKYADIPSFIDTSIDGHAGEFVFGKIKDNNLYVVVANGRFHYYEGLSYDQVHIIIDIFYNLGCKSVITTNSSGCLEPSWNPGELMIIDSHIDMTFRHSVDQMDKKYGDEYYNRKLKKLAIDCIKKFNIPIRCGTYGWTLGPTYETPAEIDLMKNLDISAVGMSTVPEIERAHELKMKLLGIACLTNYAVGISTTPLTHKEVMDQAKKSGKLFSNVILDILRNIHSI